MGQKIKEQIYEWNSYRPCGRGGLDFKGEGEKTSCPPSSPLEVFTGCDTYLKHGMVFQSPVFVCACAGVCCR